MYFDDSDPMKAASVSSRFYARKIRQFDKPIRRDLYAEPPSFRVTGLEIGELFAADRVDEKIARLTVQSFLCAGAAGERVPRPRVVARTRLDCARSGAGRHARSLGDG